MRPRKRHSSLPPFFRTKGLQLSTLTGYTAKGSGLALICDIRGWTILLHTRIRRVGEGRHVSTAWDVMANANNLEIAVDQNFPGCSTLIRIAFLGTMAIMVHVILLPFVSICTTILLCLLTYRHDLALRCNSPCITVIRID